MQRAGFDAWWPAEKLAVRGYVEVLRHYREITGIRRAAAAPVCWPRRPDVFIGVDAPDFNLWLEKRLKARGIPTIHYVSPSVWAWRGGRIDKIGRAGQPDAGAVSVRAGASTSSTASRSATSAIRWPT